MITLKKSAAAWVIAFVMGLLAVVHLASEGGTLEPWRPIARGVEYGVFQMSGSEGGEERVHVVRIDPAQAALKLVLASEQDRKLRTTAEWCKDFNLIAATNAGMFLKDYSTNVGYLRNGSHVQNKRWNRKYKSALAFDPREAGIPPAIMVDLDEPGAMMKLEGYRAVIQNLRLIKGNGIKVWEKSDRQWSEAAVGMDHEGRVLFLFCSSAFSMWEFNERIKALDLGVARLMHMEGGSVAGLSIRAGDFKIDLAGSFDTLLEANEMGMGQQLIPNVLGVQAR